jgi:hypothetical protein
MKNVYEEIEKKRVKCEKLEDEIVGQKQELTDLKNSSFKLPNNPFNDPEKILKDNIRENEKVLRETECQERVLQDLAGTIGGLSESKDKRIRGLEDLKKEYPSNGPQLNVLGKDIQTEYDSKTRRDLVYACINLQKEYKDIPENHRTPVDSPDNTRPSSPSPDNTRPSSPSRGSTIDYILEKQETELPCIADSDGGGD